MTVEAEQANEHDDKQEDVRKKRDGYSHFGFLDVEWLAVVVGNQPFITELSEHGQHERLDISVTYSPAR